MRVLYIALSIFLGLSLITEDASGQFVRSQDETMAGLEGVAVNVQVPSEWPQNVRQEIYSTSTLELRKSGLTVIEDSSEWDARNHGILNIGFTVKSGTGIGGTGDDFIWMKMDLEQLSRIVRNGNRHYLITWYHQNRMKNSANQEYPGMLKEGISQFLNDYFRANGR
jgi:hypothetical protein